MKYGKRTDEVPKGRFVLFVIKPLEIETFGAREAIR